MDELRKEYKAAHPDNKSVALVSLFFSRHFCDSLCVRVQTQPEFARSLLHRESVILKLVGERQYAVDEHLKLQQELELLSEKRSSHHGFSVMFVLFVFSSSISLLGT